MMQRKTFDRALQAILIPAAFLAAGVGSIFAEELSIETPQKKAAKILQARIQDGQSHFTISATERDNSPAASGFNSTANSRSVLVALPKNATAFQLQINNAAGMEISAPDGLMIMRGQPVVRVQTTGSSDQNVNLTVIHNGSWNADSLDRRLTSSAMNAVLGGTLPQPAMTTAISGGSYLVIYAPPFADAIAPLVQWKTLKGFNVITVSTSETGSTLEGIKNFLQNAYDTWESPPEYVLLVGDVDEIPTYNFYSNPSDQPYVHLDGDDWLQDAMIGRLPVENDFQARTMVNKIINYERYPNLADDTWQTRTLMVAGLSGSTTPDHTVEFCSDILQGIGFQPPTNVFCPPTPGLIGAEYVTAALDAGVAMLVYRGWAQGTGGWDPPVYNVANIPSSITNNMTPIVMSFVCLNGDYSLNGVDCFGEVFVRQGTPDEPGKGAVAFIGNGEHWSHTRYNDAMAISVFERISTGEITDLGTLLTAGMIRFMDYFPNEINAGDSSSGDLEESVEFYFHIYNLLGDPSMKIWFQLPEDIQVTHASNLAAGTNSLTVSVVSANDATPIANARVGIVQGGVLIGSGITQDDGSADLMLTPVVAGADISVTVSEAGVVPYEGSISTGTAPVFLSATGLTFDDANGNNDQIINPGEALALTATVHNNGSISSGEFNLAISEVRGPATADPGQIVFADLAGGASGTASSTLGLTIDADAPDGAIITLQMEATRTGDQHDYSLVPLTVAGPAWEIVGFASGDGSAPRSGQTTDLALTLRNIGSVASASSSIDLTLLTAGGSLGTQIASLPACPVGEMVTTGTVFDLTIDANTATNTNLTFELSLVTAAGYETNTNCATVAGPVDVSAPVGPDGYGYYAYDSADFDYPASRPVYSWTDISTELGGSGTKLDFPVENEVVWMVVNLPFAFQYYGESYTQMRVSDNGWISFDLGFDFDFYNWTIPTQYGVDALVAPFWDNLNPAPADTVNGREPDGIYTFNDVDNGSFVVEWSRLPHYKPQILGFQTFQLVLFNPLEHPTVSGDGEMLFLYRQVNNNDHLRMYATVGIESPDGTDGLQLSYGNINAPGMAPLQPGLAVRVTTEPPVRVPFAVSAFTATKADGQVTFEWQTTDTRPVLGWHVDRFSNGQRQRLTSSALPADSRSFTSSVTNDEGDSRYLLTALHPFGVTSEPGETVVTASGALRLALHPAHPNPTSGSTTIGFSLPREANVRLRVYDVAGRLVRTLVDGRVGSGEGIKIWDGRHEGGGQAAGGVYFYRLETGGQTLTRKMILVR